MKENVDELGIEFRMAISSPREFMYGDEGGTSRTWGLWDQYPCTQYLGKNPLRQGHTVAFPNIYQHRYTSAKLVNEKESGSATVVGMFLVDPDLSGDPRPLNASSGDGVAVSPTSASSDHNFRILSTSDVPPQQKEWMEQAVDDYIDIRLPIEVVEQIVKEVEGVLTEDEAKVYAEEMKREREEFWQNNTDRWFCLPFDVRATAA